MSHEPVDIADDQREYGPILGFGGMCFLESDLLKSTGNGGPHSLFGNIFMMPGSVAHCLDNEFQQLLNPDCFFL